MSDGPYLENTLKEVFDTALPELRRLFEIDELTLEIRVEPTPIGMENSIKVILWDSPTKQRTKATMRLTPMPMCSKIVWISDCWVSADYRGRGIGNLLHQLRLGACHSAKVRMVMCSTVTTNEREIAILKRYEWKMQTRVTGEWGDTYLWTKKIGKR